ncbi:negative regulation of cellular response to hepatocyte growth factor stimulus [Branchiostoma belcheri]|nr:negative regulation of cellular response to hepatocyte growth factor stimulus [Branchiostoma belcheri]
MALRFSLTFYVFEFWRVARGRKRTRVLGQSEAATYFRGRRRGTKYKTAGSPVTVPTICHRLPACPVGLPLSAAERKRYEQWSRTREGRLATFADGLSSYDVVHPTRVSPDGEFISHRVVHSEHQHHLRRRGADDQGRPSSPQAGGLHYKVTVDGVDLHLDLRLNSALLAPGYVLERHRGNVSRAAISRGPANPCHFVGTVPTARHSSVAISTCSGLTETDTLLVNLSRGPDLPTSGLCGSRAAEL